jgi:uncharacterized cupin superfamily protein
MEAFAMSESDARPFPVLDPASVEPRRGAAYPEHLRGPFAAREKRALGDPLGLTSFGVNLTRLPQAPPRRCAIGTRSKTSS